MKDLYSNIELVQAFKPQTISATQSAVEVDLAGFNSCVLAWLTGLEAGSLSGSLGWTLTITHADDDGTGASGAYTNVAAADVQGATPSSGLCFTIDAAAEDEMVYKLGYVGGKRFVKFLISEVGTTTGMPQAVLVIKGNPTNAPVA